MQAQGPRTPSVPRPSLPAGWKQLAAEVIWRVSEHSDAARRIARPWGMRIRQQWVGSRLASVRLLDGTTVRLSGMATSYLVFELHWKGWTYFSPYTLLTLSRILPEGGTFLDVGANIGYYALTAAALRPRLRLRAFEPSPRNFPILSANAALNGGRIECYQSALSDAAGHKPFYLPSSDMSGSLEPEFNASSALGATTVAATTLDHHSAEQPFDGPLTLKANVEGHEPAVIRGGRALISRLRPDMLMAVTRPWPDDVVSFLHDLGYRFYRITYEGLVPEVRPEPCSSGRMFFLEHYLTARSPAEVRLITSELQPSFALIDPTATNCWRPDLEGRESVW